MSVEPSGKRRVATTVLHATNIGIEHWAMNNIVTNVMCISEVATICASTSSSVLKLTKGSWSASKSSVGVTEVRIKPRLCMHACQLTCHRDF